MVAALKGLSNEVTFSWSTVVCQLGKLLYKFGFDFGPVRVSISLSWKAHSEPVGGQPWNCRFTSFIKYACLCKGSKRWSCELTFNWSSPPVRINFYINLGSIFGSSGSLIWPALVYPNCAKAYPNYALDQADNKFGKSGRAPVGGERTAIRFQV